MAIFFYLLEANFFSLKSRKKIGSDIFFSNARAIKELRYLWGFGEKSEKIGELSRPTDSSTAEEDNLVCGAASAATAVVATARKCSSSSPKTCSAPLIRYYTDHQYPLIQILGYSGTLYLSMLGVS